MRGTRLMLVSKVALGKCWETIHKDTELKGPPKGYNSVRGVKNSDVQLSEFEVNITKQFLAE